MASIPEIRIYVVDSTEQQIRMEVMNNKVKLLADWKMQTVEHR